ncbi:MAG: type II toxin-antitoxin system RelE/ParE family toxin [Betaproteobacteria bacterium HGW-Betaproteobacteria-18]|nr:MAG: type II toxin-antitoxin system RelE/ParE family toxin [Betaproteobacteria bacterium HGW-Betaproteobacteria-18]
MFKVAWTPEAEQDIEAILTYYVEEAGLRVANAIYERIKAQVGSLKMFPQRCRPGRVPDTKEYVLHRLPYIAVVQIGENTVSVLSVIHTARKYPPDQKRA